MKNISAKIIDELNRRIEEAEDNEDVEVADGLKDFYEWYVEEFIYWKQVWQLFYQRGFFMNTYKLSESKEIGICRYNEIEYELSRIEDRIIRDVEHGKSTESLVHLYNSKVDELALIVKMYCL